MVTGHGTGAVLAVVVFAFVLHGNPTPYRRTDGERGAPWEWGEGCNGLCKDSHAAQQNAVTDRDISLDRAGVNEETMQFVTLESENKSYPLRDPTLDELIAFRAVVWKRSDSTESNRRVNEAMFALTVLRLPDEFPAATVSELEKLDVVKQANQWVKRDAMVCIRDANDSD